VPSDIYYVPGNEDIYTAFALDISRSYTGEVVNLLNKNIRVLIYNGQDDFVVNTAGVLAYLNGLNWSGIPQWKRTSKKIWRLYG
jgi:carboxypeptidase C (cathepsin A)